MNWGDPADLSDADYARYLEAGPHATKAQMRDYFMRLGEHNATSQRAEAIRRHRLKWPNATASDKVIGWIIDIEQSVGRA